MAENKDELHDKLWNMNLHDEIVLEDDSDIYTNVRRVIGGWVYIFRTPIIGDSVISSTHYNITSTFVPLNKSGDPI